MFLKIIKTFAALSLAATCLNAQTAKEIVDKAEDLVKGETFRGTFKMVVHRPEFTRAVKMKSWNVGNDKALIETIYPKKEKGNKMLKIGNELWSYLKSTETTMKLPPSMMLQSWNGSDLTNDDLVRESNLAEDYHLKIMFDEKIAGENCRKIELSPKEDAPVVWGKIYYWIRKKDNLPALTQYYDEKGELKRTFHFKDIKKMGGRTIPTKWVIVDETKKNHKTEFIYLEADFDVKIPGRMFSLRELER